MGKITTHILDTASGKPASGVKIILSRSENGDILTRMTTNADGRCDSPLLSGQDLTPGRYRIDFHVGDYFTGTGGGDDIAFLDVVPVEFGINDGDGHYHIPLLISPYGYSTYRGS